MVKLIPDATAMAGSNGRSDLHDRCDGRRSDLENATTLFTPSSLGSSLLLIETATVSAHSDTAAQTETATVRRSDPESPIVFDDSDPYLGQCEALVDLGPYAGWGEALTEGPWEEVACPAAAEAAESSVLPEGCEEFLVPGPSFDDRDRLPALLTSKSKTSMKTTVVAMKTKTFGGPDGPSLPALVITAVGEASQVLGAQAAYWAEQAQPHVEAFAISAKEASCVAAECAFLRAKEAQPHVEAFAASALEASRSAALVAVSGFKAHCEQALERMKQHAVVDDDTDDDCDCDSSSDSDSEAGDADTVAVRRLVHL